jgi:hypothetical protein
MAQDQVCRGISVDGIIFAKRVKSASIAAQIERTDTEMAPFGVALWLKSGGERDLGLLFGMQKSDIPDFN